MAAKLKDTVIAGVLAFGLVYGVGKLGPMVLDANHERAHQAAWTVSGWLAGGWEGFRSRMDEWTKREAARRQAERRPHRRKGREAKAVTPSPIRFTLGPKRVYDPPRDAAEARRDKALALADYQRYGYGTSTSDGTDTEAFFFASYEASDPRGVRGVQGKLALRTADGRPLWITIWHHPSMGNPITLAPGNPRHEMIAGVRSGRPDAEYHAILAAPEAGLRLEFTPYFVAYADGTTEGELNAPFDDEGLRVLAVANGLAHLKRMRDEARAPQ